MHDQIVLIDAVHSIVPTREEWKGKPAEELPKQVTVRFEAGRTGILDMDNPHAVFWASLLDLQRRNTRPVYVEIDPETGVLTQLLLPQPSRVMSITQQGEDDAYIVFYTSAARYYLRRENPDFQEMLDALRNAKDDEIEILVTATQHDFEIIDVRPFSKPPGVETPGPLSPPQPDPPVSPQRAQELFDLMNSKFCDACNASCSTYPHCIPFLHAYDGCYARAHEMCRLMMDEGEDPEKVWIFGNLHVDTSNVHNCCVDWGWHVAPTLMVTTSNGPPEKYVIDPSLCTAPVTVAAWKALQSDPSANLEYTTWEPFWSDLTTPDPTFSLTNYYLELKCTYLQQDCVDYGPPPYVCPIVKSCHFIVDRSTFSESEIDAMLVVSNPAEIAASFYVIVDGFSPHEIGVTASTLVGVPNIKPTLSMTPVIAQMTANAFALDVEDPTHLKRRQRLTWTYNIVFTGTNGFGFTGDIESVTLSASIMTVSSSATIYLIKQPNPFEIDGETSWLSTDLRVFQIKQGQSKFAVNMGSDPSAFITQVIANLNSNSAGGQTFESDISVNQQTSRLEISQTVGGIAVYNFAIAKVRYLSLVAPATDVRVFFRLFPWATTSVAYDQTTGYRRHEVGGDIIPLPGIDNGRLTSIPCFSSPRINSAAVSLTSQTDAPNVQTIPADSNGSEVVRYYGCWLDINQTQPQFPIYPSPVDGPYTSDRISIQDHIRNEHQCIVSEIAFNPAPIPNGSTPSTSDKLAQRNIAIVESANPGLNFSRRIPQTFEIRPSKSKVEHDELMIDWGNVPAGSVATFYLPGFDANDILLLATEKYRTHKLVRIDGHTLKTDTGGITYLPIPFSDGSFPGMLTVDLPEGVEKGQVFKIVVRQVTGGQQPIIITHRLEESRSRCRRIVGSFQITIPVLEKTEILPGQQRLLSNLRWIERAIPANDHWLPVFNRYVKQVVDRVDALGGDSSKVAPSPSGQWREASRNCFILCLANVLLIAMLVVDIGALAGGLTALIGIPIVILLIGAVKLWVKKCRPRQCQLLRALPAGSGIGAIILAILALIGISTPQLVATLIAAAGVTVVTTILSWKKGCFRR